MFKFKIIIPTIIFLILLIVTSMIKNQTRIIEKKLYKLNKKISLTEKDINESQLDFHFLTSPAQIEKKVKILGQNNYLPIKNSKIFLSFSNFTDIKKNVSTFKKLDEKKIKKN
tara:strand:- start:318 stop:656 length:339 start_codon:yes stop_codon:yes gene_type:complete